MACGSIFEVLQYFCFKYTNISGELMLCINFLLVSLCYGFHVLRWGFLSGIELCFAKHWHRVIINEPRCEKTGLRGFRPGPIQTGLYSYTRWLEA